MRLKTIFEGVTVEAFMKSLRDKEARFLVYKNLPGSRLSEIIRKIRAGRSDLTLEEAVLKPKKKSSETVVVYRVHGNEIASKHPRPAKRR